MLQIGTNKQLENIKEYQCNHHKLDPSLLLQSSKGTPKKSTDNQSGTMVLRKRQINKPSHPVGASKTTYIPEMEVISKQDQNSLGAKTSSGGRGREETIFSVTTSVILGMSLVTLIGAICLVANCNHAMLVSAQFSTSNQQANQVQQPQPQQQQSDPTVIVQQPVLGVRPQTNHRQAPTSSNPTTQTQSTASSGGQKSPPISGGTQVSQVVKEEPQATAATTTRSQISIDRFDSGEQIRPPLVRQPTTLAPLARSAQQQVFPQVDNLQTAASHQSYLSPEDREQLLKSQESHYEGKNVDGPQAESASSSANADSGYEQPSRRMNQEEPSSEQDGAHLRGLESRTRGGGGGGGGGGGRQQEVAGAGSEGDDGDYEDDGAADGPPTAEPKRANAVPENRRMAGSDGSGSSNGGNSYHGRQRDHPLANNNNRPKTKGHSAPIEASNYANDDNDDYSGANDDAYFGRKSNQDGSPANHQLNQAASHNKQNRRNGHKQSAGRNTAAGYLPDQSSSGDNDENIREQNDSPGFGPGPNEAYMVDKAESGATKGAAGLDNDDDGAYSGPGDSDSGPPEAGEGGGKFDRRSMGDVGATGGADRTEARNRPYVSPINYDQSNLNPFGDSAGGADQEDDADEGGESADDSGPAFAPSSSKEETKSSGARPALGLESRLSNVLPRASASASSPQATTNPSEQMRPIPAALPVAQPLKASMVTSNSNNNNNNKPPLSSHYQQVVAATAPAHQEGSALHYRQPIYGNQHQPHLQLHHLIQHPAQPLNLFNLHKNSISAQYNPQNNPSHAGKYFIN